MFYRASRLTIISVFTITNLIAINHDVMEGKKLNKAKFLQVLARENKKIPNKAVICRLLAFSPELMRTKCTDQSQSHTTTQPHLIDHEEPRAVFQTMPSEMPTCADSGNKVITANNDDWKMIRKLIEDLDRPQRTIMIEHESLLVDLTKAIDNHPSAMCAYQSTESTKKKETVNPQQSTQANTSKYPMLSHPEAYDSDAQERLKYQNNKTTQEYQAYCDKWYC